MVQATERFIARSVSGLFTDRVQSEPATAWVAPDQEEARTTAQRVRDIGASLVGRFHMIAKSTDASGRFTKGFELGAEALEGVEAVAEFFPGLENLANLSKTIRGFQQPIYRIWMALDLLANRNDEKYSRKDHWQSYQYTKFICPITLYLVSCLGLACYLNKHKVFSWKTLHLDPAAMLWRTKVGGTGGATIAALFSAKQVAFNFGAKYHYRKADGTPYASVNSKGKPEDLHKLGHAGWNNVFSGLKYTCEAAAGAVFLFGGKKFLEKGLVVMGSGFGITQAWQALSKPKKGLVEKDINGATAAA